MSELESKSVFKKSVLLDAIIEFCSCVGERLSIFSFSLTYP